jgi:hypothetical protein
MKVLQRFNFLKKVFEDIPFKSDPVALKKDVNALEEAANKGKKKTDPKFEFQGGIDEYGREIPDPRKKIVEEKKLTMEQRVFNQFVQAHNKAVLEKDNLGASFDLSSPEKVKETIKELWNLDMPDENAEWLSKYEVVPLAEDWPTTYGTDVLPNDPEFEPKVTPESVVPNTPLDPATPKDGV